MKYSAQSAFFVCRTAYKLPVIWITEPANRMCAQAGIGHRDGHLSTGCSWIVLMAVDGHARGRIHSLAHSGQGVWPVINPVRMLLACLWIDWVIVAIDR